MPVTGMITPMWNIGEEDSSDDEDGRSPRSEIDPFKMLLPFCKVRHLNLTIRDCADVGVALSKAPGIHTQRERFRSRPCPYQAPRNIGLQAPNATHSPLAAPDPHGCPLCDALRIYVHCFVVTAIGASLTKSISSPTDRLAGEDGGRARRSGFR
jgi:hypothetical protein